MNAKRALISMVGIIFILACSVSIPPKATQPPPVVAQATYTPLPTYTPYPTVAAEQPTQAVVIADTPIAQPTVPAFTPSQWSGSLLQPWGARISMTLIVQKVTGTSFTGKLSWRISECTALMALKGEVIADINTATEQDRWAQHPDFQNGDKGGTWLRWTQTENQGDPNCYVNTGDWWYAHVINKHLTAIRFMNDTDPQPANGGLDLTLDN